MDIEICNIFLHSLIDMLKEMLDIDISTPGEFYPEGNEITSMGVCSIINFTGKMQGRFMIDMEQNSALSIIKSLTGKKYETVKEMTVLSAIAELNNTIAGDALTTLNNKYGYGLRLSPPAVLAGNEALICLDKITSYSISCKTVFGTIRVSIAFDREEENNG